MADDEKAGPDNANPWSTLVLIARGQIARIERGHTLVTQEVILRAQAALRDVTAGRPPDPEQQVYLEWLTSALHQISQVLMRAKRLGYGLTFARIPSLTIGITRYMVRSQSGSPRCVPNLPKSRIP
jgi:hypothetical protein